MTKNEAIGFVLGALFMSAAKMKTPEGKEKTADAKQEASLHIK